MNKIHMQTDTYIYLYMFISKDRKSCACGTIVLIYLKEYTHIHI